MTTPTAPLKVHRWLRRLVQATDPGRDDEVFTRAVSDTIHRLDPHVQIVMHMDGFGPPVMKRNTFGNYIRPESVQFVGWKQCYKARNDDPRTTIQEILALQPRVLYMQYQ